MNGLVLIGGKSSRMGSDKALIDYHGKPQREYLYELLCEFCAKVYLSCKSAEANSRFPLIADRFSIESPLNGILSAFRTDPDLPWLVVAVDMPFVDRSTIRYLITHRDPSKVATCFSDSDGKLPEPLLTIWEPAAGPLLFQLFEDGNISPREFLKNHNIKMLTIPDKKALVNINSREDLEKFT